MVLAGATAGSAMAATRRASGAIAGECDSGQSSGQVRPPGGAVRVGDAYRGVLWPLGAVLRDAGAGWRHGCWMPVSCWPVAMCCAVSIMPTGLLSQPRWRRVRLPLRGRVLAW